MDTSQLFTISNLIWLAFALQMSGFAVRDELKLRLLMLSGGVIYVVYFYLLTGGPFWSSVITNFLLVAINFCVTVIVIHERTMIGISGETADIYRRFSLLRPGQFRKLFRAGEVRTASDEATIIEQGDEVDALYYVLEGNAMISKGQGAISIGPDVFLGEVAYLTGVRASATVRLSPGSRYVVWRHDRLQQMIARSPEMRVALLALLNQDMAGKVAASLPMELRQGV